MNDNLTLDPLLQHHLSAFSNVPARNPAMASKGKSAFLAQAQAMSQASRTRASVTPANQPPVTRSVKRMPRWAVSFASISIIIAILLITSYSLVQAAQPAIPGDRLYPVKTAWEDVQTMWAFSNPNARLGLENEFVDRRVQEAHQLAANSKELPVQFVERWQQQMDHVLEAGASLPDTELKQTLEQTRQQWQLHSHLLNAWANMPGGYALAPAQAMYQQRLEWVNKGIQRPAEFRLRFQNRDGAGLHSSATPTPEGIDNQKLSTATTHAVSPFQQPTSQQHQCLGGCTTQGPANQGPARTATPGPHGPQYGPTLQATQNGTQSPQSTPQGAGDGGSGNGQNNGNTNDRSSGPSNSQNGSGDNGNDTGSGGSTGGGGNDGASGGGNGNGGSGGGK
jgi:uncharacterized membrane protein YgcG